MTVKLKMVKMISKIHGHIYTVSRGRIGSRIGKVPLLVLTTTGRLSGKKRRVPLAAIPYGSGYLLIASFAGSPYNPAWLLNIKQNPYVEFRIGSIVNQAIASIIRSTDSGYDQRWGAATAIYERFDHYMRATLRPIPIVELTPHRVQSRSGLA